MKKQPEKHAIPQKARLDSKKMKRKIRI